MTDEHEAINTDEENIQDDSPTSEENPSEEGWTEVSAEKTEKSTEEEPDKDDKKFTGAEKRIHQLVDERDEAREKAQTLAERLAELERDDVSQGEYAPQQPPNNQGGERELTIDDLRTIARLEVEKERTVARINSEARELEKLYPELNKDSDQFDTEVSNAVTSAVWLEIQRDPSKSVIELGEKYMKPYMKLAEKAVGQEKSNLAKQASDGALKPVNVKASDKKLEDKSIEELEAELEMVY